MRDVEKKKNKRDVKRNKIMREKLKKKVKLGEKNKSKRDVKKFFKNGARW